MFHSLKSKQVRTLDNSTISESHFMILNKNILYLTHSIDKCLALLKKLDHSDQLQRQVDKYYEGTSPQTDTDQQ